MTSLYQSKIADLRMEVFLHKMALEEFREEFARLEVRPSSLAQFFIIFIFFFFVEMHGVQRVALHPWRKYSILGGFHPQRGKAMTPSVRSCFTLKAESWIL